MPAPDLQLPVKYLPGVGPKRAQLLEKEVGISTLLELIQYFPFKYIDRTRIFRISEIGPDMPYIQLRGRIERITEVGAGRKQRLVAYFSDGSGLMELVWFSGLKWVMEQLQTGREYILFGKPTVFAGKLSMAHPEFDSPEQFEALYSTSMQPQYVTTEKMKGAFLTSKVIQKMLWNVFSANRPVLQETLPPEIRSEMRLMEINEAIFQLHFPASQDRLQQAQFRMKFEELFYIQLNLLRIRNNRLRQVHGLRFSKIGEAFHTFYSKNLPFRLTDAQMKVVREIRADLGSGRQMNRLLQGDVGSGKTLVGLMSMLMAIDNGYQAALMAPTEILANQHFANISRFITGLGLGCRLLTGSTKKAERSLIARELAEGSLHILVGTHALLEETVRFLNLGLVIIDEQHRFGVAQRAAFWEKNLHPPHVLVMTATPIPRTLALTLYGDLDISVIDALPPGRKPIVTKHVYQGQRAAVVTFLKGEIAKGRQVYVVFPMISESEKMDYRNLEEGFERLREEFPEPAFRVDFVHGKLKAADKESRMELFKTGKTHILVSTTVIEVGVDVPNASVMVIESAERFGLSQLHQLRGRVGRGSDQSFCLLLTGVKLSNESKKRIDIMVETNDGFAISEADLQLRGPGDLDGTQQSGIPVDLKMASLARDGQILQLARTKAQAILDLDPLLEQPGNFLLTRELARRSKQKGDFGMVS